MTDTPKPLFPLSPAALRGSLRIRNAAIRDLKKCNYPGSKYLDHDRALEVLRTHALEELAIRVDFYIALRGLPEDWADRVARQVVHAATSWFPVNEFYLRTSENQLVSEQVAQFIPAIERTVADHLATRLAAYIEAAKQIPVSTGQPKDRKELRDSYLASFPDAKFRDICWAAQQHYREWRRWLNGEIKDGLKPDREFRRVLTSGKSPDELIKKPRPPKWE